MEVIMAQETSGASGAPDPAGTELDQQVYDRMAQQQDFLELRSRYRRFAFPATIAFMLWYITYVVCNNWARGLMDTPVIGNINFAVVFGLLQFASTFGIAYLYSRHAGKALDPLANSLREQFEKETRR
jgi:uncharacterized membrane protein (DUF485 family)